MIQISQAATTEILRLHAQQLLNEPARFRLSLSKHGCLPQSYIMMFDQTVRTGDQELTLANSLQLVINEIDLPLLNGTAIDYSEDLMGGGFRFQNPNATQICSCGNSFQVETESQRMSVLMNQMLDK